ncbi:MAG: hypothetical protein OES09_10695 [Gammaproteobacteria bacterium]|nr:hypothetical protein [Gammaproteobacteria bacterium]
MGNITNNGREMKKSDSSRPVIGRRDFVKLCMTALAVGARDTALANGDPHASTRLYNRALLVDAENKPVRHADLVAGENYIFHYPFIATPCFLIDLGETTASSEPLMTEDGREYSTPQGVGPKGSVVAFSAICAHKMTHPAKAVSFINYRHERIRYKDKAEQQREGSQVIFCCSERSVYDARMGARVLGGPAKQPLAAIVLEYDREKDEFFAVGTRGGEMFNKFFETFAHRLQLEYRVTEIENRISKTTRVLPIDEYCSNTILC